MFTLGVEAVDGDDNQLVHMPGELPVVPSSSEKAIDVGATSVPCGWPTFLNLVIGLLDT